MKGIHAVRLLGQSMSAMPAVRNARASASAEICSRSSARPMGSIACGVLLALLFLGPLIADAENTPPKLISGMIGIFLHEAWQYNHPYATRTWTLEDYRRYAEGLRKIGYNTIVLDPLVEMMPDPLTPSDRTSLKKMARVIDMLHRELGMHVFIDEGPNVMGNKAAAHWTFEARPYYASVMLVNPEDPSAVQKLIARRQQLLAPLKAVDGLLIIDGDLGGYPNAHSSDADFIYLLKMHREMLDRIRPGIELDYWVHTGWRSMNRSWAIGWPPNYWNRTEAEVKPDFMDIFSRLKQLNPEPWGLASMEWDLPYVNAAGLASRTITFTYAAAMTPGSPSWMNQGHDYPGIEGEPSFPLTNFGSDGAYDAYRAGSDTSPRGVIANTQTPCVQLPNTFAFVRGALGKPLSVSDYVGFAGRLIRNRGPLIVAAWEALGTGTDTGSMRKLAWQLREAARGTLELGDLQGLLLESGSRFLKDLALQLELRSAYLTFIEASTTGNNHLMTSSLRTFIAAADAWDTRTGYQGPWRWPGMWNALRRLDSPTIDAVLQSRSIPVHTTDPNKVVESLTPYDNFTPRLLAAMNKKLAKMENSRSN